MPIQPCPTCQSPTIRWLEGPSKDAWVNYYRCGICGHVWNVAKSQTQLSAEITPPEQRPKPKT